MAQSPEMVLVSMVTAPVNAMARPHRILAVVFIVMLVRARILPANEVLVPKVAELPICQNTVSSKTGTTKLTAELLAVVRALPIWKTNIAFGLLRLFSVNVPVSCADDEKV